MLVPGPDGQRSVWEDCGVDQVNNKGFTIAEATGTIWEFFDCQFLIIVLGVH